ncbi:MAG: adenylate/guanylate cyclase domain-containing protein, partial [Chloroflexota bacterium]|nr:adenylate/guanylate cyclase domain-containing protein [Chloroflexota bacterium]
MDLEAKPILTIDIVKFSLIEPDSEKIRVIQNFIDMLQKAIPEGRNNYQDRMWSPAGDGGALTFSDIPTALETALNFGKLNNLHNANPKDSMPFKVRIGINLGPVIKEVDFDDRENYWGDGINISARVMSMAKPGQILVSKNYYEQARL